LVLFFPMLQITYIKENRETVIQGLQKKYYKDAEAHVDQVLNKDKKRRDTQKELDAVLAEGNRQPDESWQ
jgi:seryl-tRNA synthetase